MQEKIFVGRYRRTGWLYLYTGLTLIILSLIFWGALEITVFKEVFRSLFFAVGSILVIGAFLHYLVRVVKISSDGLSSGIRLLGSRRKVGWRDMVEINRELEHKAFLFGGIYGLQLGTKVTNSVYAKTKYGRETYLYALEDFHEDELVRLNRILREYCSDHGIDCRI